MIIIANYLIYFGVDNQRLFSFIRLYLAREISYNFLHNCTRERKRRRRKKKKKEKCLSTMWFVSIFELNPLFTYKRISFSNCSLFIQDEKDHDGKISNWKERKTERKALAFHWLQLWPRHFQNDENYPKTMTNSMNEMKRKAHLVFLKRKIARKWNPIENVNVVIVPVLSLSQWISDEFSCRVW